MTKVEALAMCEKINDITLRQQTLLDELWLLAKQAAELRLITMEYMRAH